MSLTENSRLRGQHALFSPSQPSWLNYSDDEFISKLTSKYRSYVGTEIHEWCASQIFLRHKASGLREIYKDIETHIYEKYNSVEYGLSDFGFTLLKNLKYIPEETFGTVKNYINDCVGFGMEAEVLIDFTDNFFGTADAVRFDGKSLKIFDLKTGSVPAKIEQLLIYACLYFLKYKLDPKEHPVELRIYQGNDILRAIPEANDLIPIMNTIIHFDKLMNDVKGGAVK